MTAPYQVYQIKSCLENPYIEYIFLRGAGGTGKTHTIAKFLEHYGYKHYQYIFLGPTGKSVSVAEDKGLYGSTLHRWFKILTSSTHEDINRRIKNGFGSYEQYYSFLKLKLTNVDLVFIDEISMVNNEILEHMLVTLKTIKPSIKIFLSGDYHQLPSVITNTEKNKNLTSSIEIIQDLIRSRKMAIIDFITRYRSENEEFNEFLHYLRQGSFQKSTDIAKFLRLHCNVYSNELDDELKHKLSYLNYQREIVNDINNNLLRELPGEEYSYKMIIEADRYPVNAVEERNMIVNNFQLDFCINFKIGSKILFRVNDTNGLFKNGDEGIVEDVKTNSVIIRKITAWGESTIEVHKHLYKTTEEEMQDGFYIEILQYPFSLGTARTYHKSQGDGFVYLHLDFDFLAHNHLPLETKWHYIYVGLSRIIDPSKVWIPERSIILLEKQYSMFKMINYDKFGLIFDSPAMDPQEYWRRVID